MFSRMMIASLVLVSFSGLLYAGEFHDKKNNLSARFPGTVKTIHQNDMPGMTMTMHLSSQQSVVYLAGSLTAAREKAEPGQLKELIIPYLEGVDSKLKNMRVIKQGETKLHEQSPDGYWFLIKHDEGFQIHWITIENGKMYFVKVSAKEESTLQTKQVKQFLDSINISRASK